MSVVLSPNMNLPVPVVGQEPGPQYATDINNSLNIVDAHTHSPGSGIPITPSGLNINADLTINSNNLTAVRTVRFTSQGSPLSPVAPDLNAIYSAGPDLYYNDGSGNAIQLTQNGSIAGSSGNIANLTPPASASYVSGSSTFVWQSGANIAANMDMGSIIIRKLTTGSNGITISAPNALSSDYTLTLPATLPGSTSLLTVDNAGNISTTPASVALNIVYSTSCGTFHNPGGTPQMVTNLTVTITTSGGPIQLTLIPDGSGPSYYQMVYINGSGAATSDVLLKRAGSTVATHRMGIQAAAPFGYFSVPYTILIDPQSAGTYTYEVWQANGGSSNYDTFLINWILVAQEL